MTAAEVLVANDKDLNQYVGIKKYAPYRKGGNWDKQRPERLKDLKEKLIAGRAGGDDGGGGVQVKKRKGRKERQKAKDAAADVSGLETQEPLGVGGTNKRVREEQSETIKPEIGAGESSLKKRKRRHQKSSQTASAE